MDFVCSKLCTGTVIIEWSSFIHVYTFIIDRAVTILRGFRAKFAYSALRPEQSVHVIRPRDRLPSALHWQRQIGEPEDDYLAAHTSTRRGPRGGLCTAYRAEVHPQRARRALGGGQATAAARAERSARVHGPRLRSNW